MAAAPPPPPAARTTNTATTAAAATQRYYANSIQAVHRGWNRVCDAWNTVIYASQILRVLQDEEDSSVELLCRRLVENEPKLLQLGWMMVGDYYTSKELDELVQAMMHNTSVSTISIGWSLRPYTIHRMLGAVVHMPQVENLSLVLHTSLRVESLELLKQHHPNLKRLQIQNVELRRRCCSNGNHHHRGTNTTTTTTTAFQEEEEEEEDDPYEDDNEYAAMHNMNNALHPNGLPTAQLEQPPPPPPPPHNNIHHPRPRRHHRNRHRHRRHHHNTNIMVGADNGCMLFAPRELWYQDYNIVETVADWHQLDTLQLLDCDLQEYQIVYLTQKARERPCPWNELSVAYNPHIGGKSLVRLLSKSNARRLDVTSCNITPPGARDLAKTLLNLTTETALLKAGIDPTNGLSLEVETSPLESLCLARNVYMGYGALPLITAAARRLRRLDVSHCQLPVQHVWDAIREAYNGCGGDNNNGHGHNNKNKNSSSIMTLEHLGLQGYTDYPGLKDFLKDNLPSLKTLQLSSSSTSTPISKRTQQELLEGMEANYFIQEVIVFVDTTNTTTTSSTRSTSTTTINNNNNTGYNSEDWWKFDFALQLNRIGRCILHDHNATTTTSIEPQHHLSATSSSSSSTSTTDTSTATPSSNNNRNHDNNNNNNNNRNWSQVLERASGHPDCLYWLLRNGVGKWNESSSSSSSSRVK